MRSEWICETASRTCFGLIYKKDGGICCLSDVDSELLYQSEFAGMMRQEMHNARQLACPLCCKSFHDMQDVWNVMDTEAQNNPMPAEYANWMVNFHKQILVVDSHMCSVNKYKMQSFSYYLLGQLSEHSAKLHFPFSSIYMSNYNLSCLVPQSKDLSSGRSLSAGGHSLQ